MLGSHLVSTWAKLEGTLQVLDKCHSARADLGLKGNVIVQKRKRKERKKKLAFTLMPGTVTYVISLNLHRSTE